MKKILITGAGGFIGSHLAELCVARGAKVRAFVRYNSGNRWGWLESSPARNKIEMFSGDVRDYDSVLEAMKGCDAVFHLAALVGIPYSYISPLAYLKTNVEGTYNVLEAAKRSDVKQVLVTSTSETYGTAQYVPIDEKHPCVGQSPYAASKIAADQLAVSYYRSFGLPVKIVRPFNTYGPRQSARAIIPTVITQILGGQRRIRLGNIKPTRDFTYVRDTAEGFWAVYRSAKLFGQEVNIGTGRETSIRDIVRIISKLIGAKVEILEEKRRVRCAESEVQRLCCDNKKIRKHAEWRPAFSLEKGLQETIHWFDRYRSHYKEHIYNV